MPRAPSPCIIVREGRWKWGHSVAESWGHKYYWGVVFRLLCVDLHFRVAVSKFWVDVQCVHSWV
jgi:hypothetical protein